LDQCLLPGGIVYGSFLDVETIKAVNLAKVAQYGHSIMYLGDNYDSLYYGCKPNRCIAKVSVGGKTFLDPVLEVADVYKIMELGDTIQCNVYTGDEIVRGSTDRGPLYPPPTGFQGVISRTELGLLRCVVMHKERIAHPMSFGVSPTPCVMQKSSMDGVAMIGLSVDYNKGKPAIPSDLLYLDAGTTWIAEKHDGIMGKGVYRQGVFRAVMEDGQVYKIKGFNGVCPISFVIQIEKVGDEFIATDVLSPPWGQTGSFLSRWRWLEKIYAKYNFPFCLQKWYEYAPTYGLMLLLMGAKEGVVLQSIMPPPGFVKGKAGSARYLKRVYTKDVRLGDKIVEVDATGSIIRERPDKTKPNTQKQLDRIDKAATYESLLIAFSNKFLGIVDANWKRLFDLVVSFKPPSTWPDEDLVLFYVFRNDSAIRVLMQTSTPEFLFSVLNEIKRRSIKVEKKKVEIDIFEKCTQVDWSVLEDDYTAPVKQFDLKPKVIKLVPEIPVEMFASRAAMAPTSRFDDFYVECDNWEENVIVNTAECIIPYTEYGAFYIKNVLEFTSHED